MARFKAKAAAPGIPSQPAAHVNVNTGLNLPAGVRLTSIYYMPASE